MKFSDGLNSRGQRPHPSAVNGHIEGLLMQLSVDTIREGYRQVCDDQRGKYFMQGGQALLPKCT